MNFKNFLYFLSGVVATLLVLVLLLGQPVIPNAHAAGKKMYKCQQITTRPTSTDSAEAILNKMAQDGWEYVDSAMDILIFAK